MATQIFTNTDIGAPILNGVIGSYITFLDAIIINGYNKVSGATLVSTGTVVTATLTSHGYITGDWVTVLGAAPTTYNGSFQITVTSTSTFTYNLTASTTSPATGTITTCKSGMRDLIAFNGTVPAGGFLTQSTTITRTTTTATATTSSNHGLTTGQYVTISGSTQQDYNGTFQITVTSTTTYTFTVLNSPTTPATGTIVSTQTIKSWAPGYTGTNKKAYKTGVSEKFIEITNTSANSIITDFWGTMTASATGTESSSNTASSIISSTADTTQRPWTIVTNGKMYYLFVATNNLISDSTTALTYYPDWWGEFTSVNPSTDFYNIITDPNNGYLANMNPLTGSYRRTLRSSTGVVGVTSSLLLDLDVFRFWGSSANLYYGCTPTPSLPYPDNDSGGLILQPAVIYDWNNKQKRGSLSGLYFPLQNLRTSLGNGPSLVTSTSGSLNGKTFLAMPHYQVASLSILIDLSNGW